MTVNATEFRWSFEFDSRQHMRAERSIMAHTTLWRWTRRIAGTFCVVLIVALWLLDANRAAVEGWLPIIALILFWLVFPWLVGPISVRRWKKLNPEGHRTVTIVVNDAGFRSASYAGDVTIHWPTIVRVVETSEFLLFYVTSPVAHYLPKRVVTGDDVPALREFVRKVVMPARLRFQEG